jgi:hypothetical protein
MLNKRKKQQAVNQFVGVGKGGKRGYRSRQQPHGGGGRGRSEKT